MGKTLMFSSACLLKEWKYFFFTYAFIFPLLQNTLCNIWASTGFLYALNKGSKLKRPLDTDYTIYLISYRHLYRYTLTKQCWMFIGLSLCFLQNSILILSFRWGRIQYAVQICKSQHVLISVDTLPKHPRTFWLSLAQPLNIEYSPTEDKQSSYYFACILFFHNSFLYAVTWKTALLDFFKDRISETRELHKRRPIHSVSMTQEIFCTI